MALFSSQQRIIFFIVGITPALIYKGIKLAIWYQLSSLRRVAHYEHDVCINFTFSLYYENIKYLFSQMASMLTLVIYTH